jgi:ssDNA-binding Zn-finger/Zn-ribbon topoisomerase 1
MSALMKCASCNAEISKEAVSCPSCGQPQKKAKKRRWYSWPLRIVGVIIGVIGLIKTMGGFAGASGLPACDDSAAKRQVQTTMKNAPLGRVAGLAIIEFQDVTTTSHSDERVECTASVMLNNNTQHPIRYSFFVRNKQIFVEANILDL